MPVVTERMTISTRGDAEVVDVTTAVSAAVMKAGFRDGIVTVSAVGSTAAVTTCEFEPGLVADIAEVMDRLIPRWAYHHDQAWGDGNGHAHLRASIIGPSVTIPFSARRLVLGTWQQIIFIDFDNRPRERDLVIQCLGE